MALSYLALLVFCSIVVSSQSSQFQCLQDSLSRDACVAFLESCTANTTEGEIAREYCPETCGICTEETLEALQTPKNNNTYSYRMGVMANCGFHWSPGPKEGFEYWQHFTSSSNGLRVGDGNVFFEYIYLETCGNATWDQSADSDPVVFCQLFLEGFNKLLFVHQVNAVYFMNLCPPMEDMLMQMFENAGVLVLTHAHVLAVPRRFYFVMEREYNPISEIVKEAEQYGISKIGIAFADRQIYIRYATWARDYVIPGIPGVNLTLFEEYSVMPVPVNGTPTWPQVDELLLKMQEEGVELAYWLSWIESTYTMQRIAELEIDFKAISFFKSPLMQQVASVGEKANYAISTTMWSSVLRVPCAVFGNNSNFVAGYRDYFGYMPSEFQTYGTMAGLLLQHAMQASGSFYIDRMIESLEILEVDSIWGPIRFSVDNQNIGRDPIFLQVQDEVVHIVKPASMATASLELPTPSFQCRKVILADNTSHVCEDDEFAIWRMCIETYPSVRRKYNSTSCLAREDLARQGEVIITQQVNTSDGLELTHIWVILAALVMFCILVVLFGVWYYQQKVNAAFWLNGKDVIPVKDSMGTLVVVGMGAFGVVFVSDFRGTKVAVKCVVPKNYNTLKRSYKSLVAKKYDAESSKSTDSISLNTISTLEIQEKMVLQLETQDESPAQSGPQRGETSQQAWLDSTTVGPASPQAVFAWGDPTNTTNTMTMQVKASGSEPLENARKVSFDSDRQQRVSARQPVMTGNAGFIRKPHPLVRIDSPNWSQQSLNANGDPRASKIRTRSLADVMSNTADSQSISKSSTEGTRWISLALQRIFWGMVGRNHIVMQMMKEFKAEFTLLSKLRHPHIVTVLGAYVDEDRGCCIVMEYMEYGSLYDTLHNLTAPMDETTILRLLLQVTQGIQFLHEASPPVIHGDIKSPNILLGHNLVAKVADFGTSIKFFMRGGHGTPFWMAPELLLADTNEASKSCLATAADIYSLGITIWETFARQEPYHEISGKQPMKSILHRVAHEQLRPTMPEGIPEEVQHLIRDCWADDPSARPTIRQVRERLETLLHSVESEILSRPSGTSLEQLRNSSNGNLFNQTQLLHQILPPKVVQRLAMGMKVEPETFDPVTIFFSDIVGYTDLSGALPAEKVMSMLDRLYTQFDALCTEAGLFKVETIGDAYMCVGGLPEPQKDHTKRVAMFALKAVRSANSTLIDEEDESLGHINIRVGFHSGPVVASVVGELNPRYCLFGDTVNYASRMESNSAKNKINMSPQANNFLLEQAPHLITHSRGQLKIKGKGNIECFFLDQGPLNFQALFNQVKEVSDLCVADF